MKKTHLELLQNMPIFGGITNKILEFILQQSKILSIPTGKYFFKEGEKGSSTYVLEQGKVAIIKEWEKKLYRIGELSRGDCFGEMSMIDLEPRSASIVAIEDCSAIKLTQENVFSIYHQDFEQFAIIEMNMGREISRRLRKLDKDLFLERIENNKLTNYQINLGI